MTDTARYADIVLPAASYLETDDLYRAYGAYWMQWGQKAAEPAGEARSNFHVAQALAQRMDVTDRIFSLTPREAAEEFFKGATGPASKADPATSSLPACRRTSRTTGRASPSRRRRASWSSIPSSSPSRACRRFPTGSPIRSRKQTPRSGRCAC
jgi:hypothetical protein